jgi:hypothetical protein
MIASFGLPVAAALAVAALRSPRGVPAGASRT